MFYQQFSVAEESLGQDGKKFPLAWWSLYGFDPYIVPRIKNRDSRIQLKSKEVTYGGRVAPASIPTHSGLAKTSMTAYSHNFSSPILQWESLVAQEGRILPCTEGSAGGF